jgi:hypothetical protein
MSLNDNPLLRPTPEIVRGWSPAEAEQQVRELLDAYDRGALDNYDKLHRVGITLGGTGHHLADQWGVRWAAQDPNEQRLEIASTLAWGLWNPGSRHVRPTPDAVRELIALRERVQPNEGIDYVTLMALADAARVADVRELARPVLLTAREQPLSHPDLNRTLQATIKHVLGD